MKRTLAVTEARRAETTKIGSVGDEGAISSNPIIAHSETQDNPPAVPLDKES